MGQIHQEQQQQNRRDIDRELEVLEVRIGELKVLYEQHFADILPQPPDKEHRELKMFIRRLLKAPFKNSQSRFKLRHLINRFQTYNTYWERVKKEREEGIYKKDLFKAELREKEAQYAQDAKTDRSKLERGLKDLYATYEDALRKVGANMSHVNYDAFKKTLIERAKELKKKHGAKKLNYKVIVKNGKVVIKAKAGN
ncbi:hypothetical protein JNK13_10255 [bacterium]|nr:hypothetical protein [bacterium]